MIEAQRVGDLAEITMGLSPSSDSYNGVGEGMPLLNGPTEFGARSPRATLFTTDPKRVCAVGDLIFCVRGNTTGKWNVADQPYALGRGVAAIRGFQETDTHFVGYALEVGLPRLLGFAGGSTMPNLRKGDIENFEILVPPGRGRVVGIVRTMDDLIENNRRRIEILEEMARLIYREWFVRYRFPGHEDVELVDPHLGRIPEGWERVNLFDLAEVGFGFSFKAKQFTEDGPYPVVRIRDIPNNATNTFTDEEAGDRYLIVDGDILIGMDGDFHMCRWASGTAYLNQRVTRIRTSGPLSRYQLFLALEQPIRNFNDSIIGTTVAHLGKRHLQEIDMVVASPEVLDEATNTLEPMFDLEIALRKQNQVLTQARDLLLPRLISGDLDVSDLDLDLDSVA